MLVLELENEPDAAEPCALLGLEAQKIAGLSFLRHWFDLDDDAGLLVDIDPVGGLGAYLMGFPPYGEPVLQPI